MVAERCTVVGVKITDSGVSVAAAGGGPDGKKHVNRRRRRSRSRSFSPAPCNATTIIIKYHYRRRRRVRATGRPPPRTTRVYIIHADDPDRYTVPQFLYYARHRPPPQSSTGLQREIRRRSFLSFFVFRLRPTPVN